MSHFSPCLPLDTTNKPISTIPRRLAPSGDAGIGRHEGAPDKVRRRKFSRIYGFASILTPIFFQWSAVRCKASTSSVCSLLALDR
jgi:hypothetical protein